jgi:hypothetical protein
MKRITIIFVVILLSGCSRKVTTAWKTEHILPVNLSRLLVVAILPDADSLEREKTERNFAVSLQDMGYQAVPAVVEFGLKGLANLDQATTYTTVCSRGFDAVITVALVNEAKESDRQLANARTYRSNYYYQRIWEYKNILTQPEGAGDRYYWESILFDLSTLEALCVVQAKPSDKAKQFETASDIDKRLIQRMIKEKTLKKQKVVKTPKAF